MGLQDFRVGVVLCFVLPPPPFLLVKGFSGNPYLLMEKSLSLKALAELISCGFFGTFWAQM